MNYENVKIEETVSKVEKLDIKKNEIGVLYFDMGYSSRSALQVAYDRIDKKRVFENLIVLPNGSTLNKISKEEIKLWIKKTTKFLENLD